MLESGAEVAFADFSDEEPRDPALNDNAHREGSKLVLHGY